MTEDRVRCAVPGDNHQQINVCSYQLIRCSFKSGGISRFANQNAGYFTQCLTDNRLTFTGLTAHGIEQAADFG